VEYNTLKGVETQLNDLEHMYIQHKESTTPLSITMLGDCAKEPLSGKKTPQMSKSLPQLY